MKRIGFILIAASAISWAGCGSAREDVCEPGIQTPCTCQDGASGMQTCRDDGSGWEACDCTCTPDCSGRDCGPDPVCESSCGTCGTGETCTADGRCVAACTPDCTGRVCGLDPVCATTCGQCDSGQTCTQDGQCTDQGLTLVGRTTAASGTITIELGGQEASTQADVQGNYEITIAAPDASQVLAIRVRGDQALGQGHLELGSVLDTAGELIARAGADMRLTADEHSGVLVTPCSTGRYAALVTVHGQVPATRAALIEAEQTMNGPLTADEILDIAAAIHLVLESPAHDLPAGFDTTLDWVQDPPALRAFIEQVRPPYPVDNPLDNARALVLQEEDLLGNFRSNELPSVYLELVKHRNGFVGVKWDRYELTQAGRGIYEPFAWNGSMRQEGFSWQIADGMLSIQFDAPADTHTAFIDADGFAELFPDDPALQQQIRTALGGGGVDVVRELAAGQYRLTAEGVSVDLVAEAQLWRYRTRVALEPFGIDAPDVDRALWGGAHAWFRDDHLVYQAFTEGMVVGTWVMPVVAPSDLDELFDEVVAGQPVFRYAVVAFDAQGTARAFDGVIDAPMDLTWRIQDDDRLRISYPDGAEQTVAIWDEQESEHGLMTWYQAPAGATHMLYWRAVKLDTALQLTPADLHTSPGDYWQTTINRATLQVDAQGRLPWDDVFGFQFSSGGLANRVMVLYDDPDHMADPYLWEEDYWNFDLAGGDVHIEIRYDKDRAGRCSAQDPSCFLYRVRRWLPVARSGDLLYVLETDRWIDGWLFWFGGGIEWDAGQQAWVHTPTGEPADLDARRYMILPRLNAYYRESLPVF